MGRTSKFSFSVPGRRQKPPPQTQPSHAPTTKAPLTKAQKILGTGELNVGAPNAASRYWETKSNAGISVAVSETTHDTSLRRIDEGEVNQRQARWDDESAILPWENQTIQRNLAGNDMVTEASSMRRQRSSSTINTYYDSSKVPLSISQQTASSAIAKGLPSKASALLDVEGNFMAVAKTVKKKPSRLDLSHLLTKSKSGKHLAPPDAAQRAHVLGPDLMTRSPSMMSASPDMAPAPPPIQQRSSRQPRRRLTLETLREKQAESVAIPVQPMPQELRRRMRTSASAHELHNLYENYEQRSFQDMVGGDAEMDTANADSVSPTYGQSPTSLSVARGFLSPYSNSTSRGPHSGHSGHSGKETLNSQASGPGTPTSSVTTPSSLKSPRTDYAASVSSRHTRTSKASKKTDRSLTELDLRQNSVLSLSSDSDDDYSERPTSLSAPRRPSDSQASTTSAELGSFPQPPSPGSSIGNRRDSLPRRISTMSPMDFSDLAAYNSYHSAMSTNKPEVAARTSSQSLSSQATMKAPSRQSSSHFSLASTVTVGSVAPTQKPSPGHSSSRAIAMIPAPGFPSASRAGRSSNTSDQIIPPSPTSIDFYMQSQHNSMAFDNGSIRSGNSMGEASSRRGSTGGDGNDGDGRFIAVTAQEERLLAALRIKRARMRDKIIAEFEEEQDEAVDVGAPPIHHLQPQYAYDQSAVQPFLNPPPNQPLPAPPKKSRSNSDQKRTSSRPPARFPSAHTARLAPLPEQPHAERQQQLQSAPPARLLPATRYAGLESSNNRRLDNEQTLMYVDRRIAKFDSLDASEHNRQANGFVDFDNVDNDNILLDFPLVPSEGSSRSTSESRSQRSRASSSRSEAPSQESALSPPSAKEVAYRPRREEKKHGHVQVLEDVSEAAVDMPRPDSPISSVPDFPVPNLSLPRKKQVRLSAVGYQPMEAGWWADDG